MDWGFTDIPQYICEETSSKIKKIMESRPKIAKKCLGTRFGANRVGGQLAAVRKETLTSRKPRSTFLHDRFTLLCFPKLLPLLLALK